MVNAAMKLRHLLLGRKAMTNQDSILKNRAIALTTQIFVSNVISLLFNMLYRFDIAFLPRSKCLNFMAPVTVYGNFGA